MDTDKDEFINEGALFASVLKRKQASEQKAVSVRCVIQMMD